MPPPGPLSAASVTPNYDERIEIVRKEVFHMMHKGCRCFHHPFALAVSALGGAAAVLFFWAALSGTMVLGLDDTFYFEAVIVLAVAAHGTKFCRCCRDHGMGYGCADCEGPVGMSMEEKGQM